MFAAVVGIAAFVSASQRVVLADEECGPGLYYQGFYYAGRPVCDVVPPTVPSVPEPTTPKPAPTPTTTTVLATTTTAATTTTTAADPCEPDNTVAACDQDDDGLTNAQEKVEGTDPTEADTDGDGVLDGKDRDSTTPAGADVDSFGVEITITTEAVTTAPSGDSNNGGGDGGSSTGLIVGLTAGGLALLGATAFALKRRGTDTRA